MPNPRFDVLAIGNAIVDIIARTEEDFLVREGLAKSAMRLIDAAEAERLYGHMGPAIEASGGSAGNTAAGVASLGGRVAFIGKVADDPLGDIYDHDMRSTGVYFATARLVGGAPTARSMILITPDGERTMNTFLGACQELSPDDIDADVVAAAGITYLEGYLWDPPQAKEAFRKAAAIAHAAGRQVSLTLSDAFCVSRFRAEFLGLMRDGLIDILFANEAELKSLYETGSLDAAIAAVREDTPLTALTVGARGSYVVTRSETHLVPVAAVSEVVDTTGAGDLYASGFLFGLARGMDLRDCAALGGLAAGEVIAHIGPRPATSLKVLAGQSGFAV